MREVAVLLNEYGMPLYWHAPDSATSYYLPDSRPLWNVMWELRAQLREVAHVHPGMMLEPSDEDLTTFDAVDLALGTRIAWSIVGAQGGVAIYQRGRCAPTYAREALVEPGEDDHACYRAVRALANAERPGADAAVLNRYLFPLHIR